MAAVFSSAPSTRSTRTMLPETESADSEISDVVVMRDELDPRRSVSVTSHSAPETRPLSTQGSDPWLNECSIGSEALNPVA